MRQLALSFLPSAERPAVLDVVLKVGGTLCILGLIGFDLYGLDLDKRRLNMCVKNLDHNELKGQIAVVDLCKERALDVTVNVVICNCRH